MADRGPHNDRGSPLSQSDSLRQLYTDLELGEIRTLLLAPGTSNSPVEVELEVTPSVATQQYEALSYVWGPARADHHIHCNHVIFQVTESLYTALLHLRYAFTWRRLWVDQICIDQNDEDELMDQVTRMGSIYSNSSRVVVWLGERDEAMSKAWKIIQESCLSVSLVRSDFLDKSPMSSERNARADSASSNWAKSWRIRRSDILRSSSASSRSSRNSTLSKTSTFSKTRPLRKSFNGSSSSLSSSASSFSSSSGISNQPPRTPIRKRSTGPFRQIKVFDRSPSWSSSETTVSTSPKALQPSKLKLALSVFQHKYFTRLWTFQEIVLSPAAIFVTDGIEFALADLMGWYFHYVGKPTFSNFSPPGTGAQNSPGDTMVYDSMGSFENIMHVRHQLAGAEEASQLFATGSESLSSPRLDMKFSTLLMVTRQLQTLKAEDRVLSLLGLHRGFESYLTKITDIEGWLPVPELFLTAFRYCVEVEQSLDILSAAGVYLGNKRKGFEGWPSWLPDWREAYPLRPLVLNNFKTGFHSISSSVTADEHIDSIGHVPPHQASNILETSYLLEEDEYGKFTFEIHGYRLGIVLTRSNSWPGRFFVPGAGVQALLTAGDGLSSKHAQSMESLTANYDHRVSTSPYTKSVLASAQQEGQLNEPLRTSAAVEPGDWVCILSGGPTLYILRPTADTSKLDVQAVQPSEEIPKHSSSLDEHIDGSRVQCRFIGECAVDAMMDGFFATRLLDDPKKLQSFQFELV